VGGGDGCGEGGGVCCGRGVGGWIGWLGCSVQFGGLDLSVEVVWGVWAGRV